MDILRGVNLRGDYIDVLCLEYDTHGFFVDKCWVWKINFYYCFFMHVSEFTNLLGIYVTCAPSRSGNGFIYHTQACIHKSTHIRQCCASILDFLLFLQCFQNVESRFYTDSKLMFQYYAIFGNVYIFYLEYRFVLICKYLIHMEEIYDYIRYYLYWLEELHQYWNT